MPRHLLLHSDSVLATTGFGRVSREIARALVSDGWTVTQVGVNHPDRWVCEAGGVKIYPAPLDHRSPFAEGMALELLSARHFDAALVIQDPDVAAQWAEPWFAAAPKTKTVLYCPVDGPFVDAGAFEFARRAAVTVPYDAAGRRVMAEFGVDAHAPIPHGVDVETFHPSGDRAALRRLLGVQADDDVAVVTMVARQIPRKDPFLALQAVRLLGKTRPAMFYFHGPANEGYGDLHLMARSLGMTEGVHYRVALPEHLRCDDATLACLYTASDVLLFTSRREGWGLPAIEGMACGLPVVAPAFGPFFSFPGPHGFLYALSGRNWPDADLRGPSYLSTPENVADALRLALSEWSPGKAALARSAVEPLAWPLVHAQWRSLMGRLVPA